MKKNERMKECNARTKEITYKSMNEFPSTKRWLGQLLPFVVASNSVYLVVCQNQNLINFFLTKKMCHGMNLKCQAQGVDFEGLQVRGEVNLSLSF